MLLHTNMQLIDQPVAPSICEPKVSQIWSTLVQQALTTLFAGYHLEPGLYP